MNAVQGTVVAGSLVLALGLWLVLPRAGARGRGLGMFLAPLGVGLLASQLPPVASLGYTLVFWGLAAVTVISALGAVSMRSPVYCAIWFALALMGTAGLFLVAGAQFLAVATITVYAGAILVTFLFVLMLGSPEGNAYYDQVSWEAPLSALAGSALVGLLTMTTVLACQGSAASPPATTAAAVPSPPPAATAAAPAATAATAKPKRPTALAAWRPVEDTVAAADRPAHVLHERHVERLGRELFGRYLLSVEAAGVLLLVALVGATAIAIHARPKSGERAAQVVTLAREGGRRV